MKCTSYCRVARYRTAELARRLKKHYQIKSYEGVVHAQSAGEDKHAFFFPYGVAIFWNLDSSEEHRLLDTGFAFAEDHLAIIEEDEFKFCYGSQTRISRRKIVLPDDCALSKLAASHAIAQSAKLGTFELTITQLIKNTEHIPRELAQTGKQPFRAKVLRQMMGRLYMDLSSVNLHFDLLDAPDFFWDYEEIEPIYTTTSKYLDIEDRVTVLNQRMQVVRDLFEMLSDEAKHKQSSRLELVIIWLIVIEVVVLLVKDVFNWI